VDPGAGQRRLDALCPRKIVRTLSSAVRERAGVGRPRGCWHRGPAATRQQGVPHGQRGPHRRKRCRGVVKEDAVAIAVMLELSSQKAVRKRKQHFDHRPGARWCSAARFGREWRLKRTAPGAAPDLQDAERER